MSKVVLIGHDVPGCLEHAYLAAFEALGWDGYLVNLDLLVVEQIPFGRVGGFLNQYLAVEPWLRKVNNSVVSAVRAHRPDLIVSFGMSPGLRVGALAQLRADAIPSVLVWPDSLTNWGLNDQTRLGQFDLVASYSSALLPSLERLAARSAMWLPFGVDPAMVLPSIDGTPTIDGAAAPDVSFVGGWRPEREAQIKHLSEFDVHIWGPGWAPAARRDRHIRRMWRRRSIFLAEFAAVVRSSRVSLNFIHPSNLGGANMRFFEILGAGGLQLSTRCTEMEESFRNAEHLYYFDDPRQLPAIVRRILADPEAADRIRRAGHEAALSGHTYNDRVAGLLRSLASLGNSASSR